MRILVIGDLHGQKPRIHFKNFDCIIQVGDVCSDKEFRLYINKWFNLLKSSKEVDISVDDLIINSIGKRGLKKLEKDSLKQGKEILEYLNSFGKPVFIVPGNWDQSFKETKEEREGNFYYIRNYLTKFSGERTNSYLTKGLKNVFDCQFNLNQFGKINFIGYGLSSVPEKPNRKKDKITKRQFSILKKKYDSLLSKLFVQYIKRDKSLPIIFITHNIPHGKLDLVKNKKNYANNKHLGSNIAEDFCKRAKPLLCIGGHIHEAKGKAKIGKTVVINAGFGKDAQVLIEVDEKKKKIKKIKFF